MPLHTTPSRRGFILVMTLMLLAIAAVALAATARSSMGLAVHAVQERNSLQRKWGNHSIRHTTLELSRILLETDDSMANEPVMRNRIELSLSGQSYTITVSDEQAKVNINALLKHKGRDAARIYALSQFTDSMGSSDIYLPTGNRNSQVPRPDEDTELERKIVSINHLMPGFSPDNIKTSDGYPLEGLTCWGDGRINLQRAPDELVREVTAPILGSIQIKRIRDTLATSEDQSLSKALVGVGIPKEDIPGVLERLTLESRCYSVWIATDDGRRRWHELSVLELEPDEITEQHDADAETSGDTEDSETPPFIAATPTADNPEATHALTEQQSNTPPQAPPKYPRLQIYQW